MGNVRRMWRPSATLVVLFAVGYLGIVGYARAMRMDADDVPHGQQVVVAPTTPAPAAPDEMAPSTPVTPARGTEPAQAGSDGSDGSSDASVGKWVAAAAGDDAKAREAAITALAKAPRAQAIPALTRVLKSGDPGTDKPLALRSLRTLAIDQGDADNRIREVLRDAVYHGDEESLVQGAQSTLDEVEQAVSGRRPR